MRKKDNFIGWLLFGAVGFVIYKILTDEDNSIYAQDVKQIPDLSKMKFGVAYPIMSLSLLDSELEEKKKHIRDLNTITAGQLLIQLDENNGNLTVRRMAENFLYPKAVFMIYLLISNPSFQLEIRNRKNDDYRIFPNNNAGTGHTKVIAPLLKKGKTNGSLIVIDRNDDENAIYHLENEDGSSPTPTPGNLSSYRVLRHELIHAYRNLTRRSLNKQDVVKVYTGKLSLRQIPKTIGMEESLAVGRIKNKFGEFIGIQIHEDFELKFSKFENKIPFNEAIFTKERNREKVREAYRVEYHGL
ncbi:MAG: hypothetical protein IPL26_23160 [Leptospiraceae bacterium]|nr:hypothetical protein [Leptospiraceae bacterium]